MAYSEELANRLRRILETHPNVTEKAMFGGLAFMVNEKMCVGIIGDELMCRIDPEEAEKSLLHNQSKPMTFTGRNMKGYVMVEPHQWQHETTLRNWVALCLTFNPKAKKSKK